MTIDKTSRTLIGGAFLYSLALVAFAFMDIPDWRILGVTISPFIYLTPLFGLPYVLISRPGAMRIVYFLLFVPIVHNLAITCAAQVAGENLFEPADVVGGAVGGLVGAAASFAILALISRSARTLPALKTALAGTLLLAAIGAVGLHLAFQLDENLSFVILYLPWQLVFALCLGRMLESSTPVSRPVLDA
jgi:hypothetical protein